MNARGTERLTLGIEGMSCGGCARGVQVALSGIPGVYAAAVDFGTGRASVEYDPAEVTPGTFGEVLARNGFTATELPA